MQLLPRSHIPSVHALCRFIYYFLDYFFIIIIIFISELVFRKTLQMISPPSDVMILTLRLPTVHFRVVTMDTNFIPLSEKVRYF